MKWFKQGCVVVLALATVCGAVAQAADSVLDASPSGVELNGSALVPVFETTPAPRDATGADRVLLKNGIASWYGPGFHGRRTANGERYNMHDLTAAHRYLPFGTLVKVRSVHTGKSVVVRINDRGPYKHKRIIDLSRGAMEALGTLGRGVTQVEVWVEKHQVADFKARKERFLNRSAVKPKQQRPGKLTKQPSTQSG